MYEALQHIHCSTIVTSYADQLQTEGFNGSQKLGQYGWTIPQNFHIISMTKFRFWQPSYFHKSFLHVHVHIDLQKPLLWIKCTYSIV